MKWSKFYKKWSKLINFIDTKKYGLGFWYLG